MMGDELRALQDELREDELRELRAAVEDFARGVITLDELVEIATGRRP